jgi:Endonuclease/Exonuclease/phosphatase family
MKPRLLHVTAALLVTTACQEATGNSSGSPSMSVAAGGASGITVMTQNLYVGADVDRVIHALATPDPNDDFTELMFAIETVGKTDFPARANAIADEIARTRPVAVGLQEVSTINIDLRPLGVQAVVNQDFLAILQAALASRGLNYQVAAVATDINASLLGGLVSLVDHDAMLVDASRVTVNAASGQDFAVNLGPVAPGVTLIRGWVWARTTIDGQAYTFASAHPEANLAGAPVALLEQIRAAQVGEIVATIAAGPNDRVVIMGDLNDHEGSPMYGVLSAAGYADTWRTMRPGTDGLTCCHVADLSDKIATFDQRIDYVWTRGFARDNGTVQGGIDRFGKEPSDQLQGPVSLIWPSDHAGLVATLK